MVFFREIWYPKLICDDSSPCLSIPTKIWPYMGMYHIFRHALFAAVDQSICSRHLSTLRTDAHSHDTHSFCVYIKIGSNIFWKQSPPNLEVQGNHHKTHEIPFSVDCEEILRYWEKTIYIAMNPMVLCSPSNYRGKQRRCIGRTLREMWTQKKPGKSGLWCSCPIEITFYPPKTDVFLGQHYLQRWLRRLLPCPVCLWRHG